MPEDVLVEAVRSGSEVSVEAALNKHGKGLDKLNAVGVSSIQVAVWRNHLPILEKLLEAGAAVDVQDLESGWTAMHRCLYLGRLCAAAKLLNAGAHLNVSDVQGRTPLDLLSHELRGYLRFPSSSACAPQSRTGHRIDPNHVHLTPAINKTSNEAQGECRHLVFGWGSGANYQLGVGSVDVHTTPTRIDALQHLDVVQVAASKFHSAAVTSSGQVYTWGWGRGGRLGHPDSLIHSKLSALLLPRLVAGLGRRTVVCVAAGKHHTLVCTTAGEIFAWGTNKHSCLGVPAAELEMQPTPRKVTSIQHKRVVAVSAARKHSAALTHKGEVYTWGGNPDGQLGYATPDSADNPHPRIVENLKGRTMVALSLSKHHTVAMTVDGEVYTWGYRAHIPKRVKLEGSRDIARCTSVNSTTSSSMPFNTSSQSATSSRRQVSFHRGQSDVMRPMATSIAAGEAHTSVLVHTGEVLMWHSADSSLTVQEVGGQLAGKCVTYISAGRTRTAAVTDQGDVYMWEGNLPRYRPDTVLSTTPGSGGRSDPGSTPPLRSLSNTNLGAAADTFSGRGSLSQAHTGGLSGSMGTSLGAGGSFTGSGGGNFNTSNICSTSSGAVQPQRVLGLKRACAVAVGEKHSLALQSWSAPSLPNAVALHKSVSAKNLGMQELYGEREDSDDESLGAGSSDSESLDMDEEDVDDVGSLMVDSSGVSRSGPSWDWQRSSWEREAVGSSPYRVSFAQDDSAALPSYHLADACSSPAPVSASWGAPPTPSTGYNWTPTDLGESPAAPGSAVPPLQDIMQLVVAQEVVEPRTVLPILELADLMGASMLRDFCMAVALRNLDAVILEARGSLAALPDRMLAELEGHYRQTFLRPSSPRSGSTLPGASPRASATVAPTREPSHPRASSPQPGSSPLGVSFMDSIPTVLQAERSDTSRPRLQTSRRPSAPPAWLSHTLPGFSPIPAAEQAAALQRAKEHLMNPMSAVPSRTPPSREGGSRSTSAEEEKDGQGGEETEAARVREEQRREEQETRERMLRSVRKKLTQIDELRERLNAGDVLDAQQKEKLGLGALMWQAVSMLEQGIPVAEVQHVLETGRAGLEYVSRPAAQATATGQSESQTQAQQDGFEASTSSSSHSGIPHINSESLPSIPSSARSSAVPVTDTQSSATSSSIKSQARKAARKGDLSEFLSGVLEKKKTPVESGRGKGESGKAKEETLKSKGPAWGGAGVVRTPTAAPGESSGNGSGAAWPGLMVPPESVTATTATAADNLSPLSQNAPTSPLPSSSLSPSPVPRHSKPSLLNSTPSSISPVGSSPNIPTPPSKSNSTPPSKSNSTPPSSLSFPKPASRPPSGTSSSTTLSLADFVKADSRKASKKKQTDTYGSSPSAAKGPAWGGLAGSSPPTRSFMAILEEQKLQHQRTPSWGPAHGKSTAAGKGNPATIRPSPPANSKWFVAESTAAPKQALQHIQKEEAAIKQLQKLYGGDVQVKVVQPSQRGQHE